MHVTNPFDRLRGLNKQTTIRGVYIRINALSTLIIFKINTFNEVQKVLNLSNIIQVPH